MKTKKVVETALEKLYDENWLYYDPNPKDSDSEIIRITQENIEEAAKFYKVPEPFLRMVDDAIRSMVNEIIGQVTMDLEDVWKKVDD
jgi:glutamyl-tRNA reductase